MAIIIEKHEAMKLISAQVAIATAAIAEAERIADQTGVGFSLDIGGYGMGGYYNPEVDGGSDEDDDYDEDSYGWQASSQSC